MCHPLLCELPTFPLRYTWAIARNLLKFNDFEKLGGRSLVVPNALGFVWF
jgi:hypothetical protein